MELQWIKENSPRWDVSKAGVFGAAEPSVLGLGSPSDGDVLADEWWRAEVDGTTVGFGRLDSVWGDAEILVAVDSDRRRGGLGREVLGMLERSAADEGLNYLYNKVSPEHPDREGVIAWLHANGFAETADGDYRKRIERL